MQVLSEEKLVRYLAQVLELSAEVLPRLAEEGTRPAPEEIRERFDALISALAVERDNDSTLQDEQWNWIWQTRPEMNLIQVYGRLAWVNLQLLELL